MAEIVLGAALSHSPQTCVRSELWDDLAARDRSGRKLLGVDGDLHTYDELIELAPAAVHDALKPDAARAMFERSQKGLDTIAETVESVNPDVVIIVGDDQHELFLNDGVPIFAMYWGDELADESGLSEKLTSMSPGLLEGFYARHAPGKESYRVASELAKHLVIELVDQNFDLCQFTSQPAGRSLGHAFTAVQRRILPANRIPMIPLFQNTYFPPNQPSPTRCYDLGLALAGAIKSWPGSERVAIIASGGLSHVTVDEELDEMVLTAFADRDRTQLSKIPKSKLRFGTSEILNWVTAAGALEHLSMNVVDYIAGYRSLAGTGAGMGYALWQ